MDAPAAVAESQLAELGLEISAQPADLDPHNYILDQLQKYGVDYQYLSHQPVYTSQESAQVRGTSLSQSAKALVLDTQGEYILYVVPGDERADLEALQQELGVKKVAMASKESVEAKTGLGVGSIPPFGSAVGMKTYVAESLTQLDQIAFNVGRHDRSIIMSYQDFMQVETKTVISSE
jgi:Ala-tRNA(Pro) deacylase